MKPQLGWKKEASAGTNEFNGAAVTGTPFGAFLPNDDLVFPLPSHEATLTYKEGEHVAGYNTKGANTCEFTISRQYNHGYGWVHALGKVSDEGGGLYKVTAGPLSSYSIYSQYTTPISAYGCKVNEYDFISNKLVPIIHSTSWIGMGIETPTEITADPPMVTPANIEDFVGGWLIDAGDLKLGTTNLVRCDSFSVKILRGVNAVHTNSRNARRIHDPEIVAFVLQFSGDFDGEKEELINAIIDNVADQAFHYKLDIDGTHYHQIDIDHLDLQTPRVEGAQNEPNTYDVVASGYGAFEVNLYDGHDYTTL